MPFSHILLTLLVVVVWGFNFVVIKEGMQQMPPLLLACTRFFLTSFPSIFFVKRPKIPFKMVVGYGLLMFVFQISFLFMGINEGVSPGIASLLTQVQVFFTILLGALFFYERLHRWQVLGSLLVVAGISLIAVHLDGSVTLRGFFFIIAGAVSWSFGNVISKKMGRVDMTALVVWGSLIAWPLLLGASYLLEGTSDILGIFQSLNWISWGSIFFIAYPATIVGFGLWSWLLHHHPLGVIAPFSVLVPICALASSILVLGEPLEMWKVGASLLVIGGLCVNVFGPKIFRRRNG